MNYKYIVTQASIFQASKKCEHCLTTERVHQKYIKLVDLLQRKIKQMQAIIGTQMKKKNSSTGTQEIKESIKYEKEINSMQLCDVTSSMSTLAESHLSFTKQVTNPLQRELSPMLKHFNKTQGNESFELSPLLVNGSTSNNSQFKSNLTQIRYCFTAFVKQLKLGDLSSNPALQKALLPLLNILQFSKEERQEMLKQKVSKIKKTPKHSNKQNILVWENQV